jgi:hypothetical protein
MFFFFTYIKDVILCDDNGVVLHRILKAYCNTLRWDSIGDILAIAGFGNLAGFSLIKNVLM